MYVITLSCIHTYKFFTIYPLLFIGTWSVFFWSIWRHCTDTRVPYITLWGWLTCFLLSSFVYWTKWPMTMCIHSCQFCTLMSWMDFKEKCLCCEILLRQTQTKHKISVPAWFYILHVKRMCWSNQIHLSDRVDPRIKCSPRIRIKAANKMFNNLQIGVERKFRLAPLRYIF